MDGDNDPDVLITGKNNSGIRIAKLYTNDGAGNYSEVLGTSFEKVGQSSIAFADVDGDNDPDVLITGINNSGAAITKLYTNDGMGHYAEAPGTPFEGVGQSSIAFSDVDGDNDPDVLITGENNSGIRIAKLYTNSGTGNYSEVTGTPFVGLGNGAIAFADLDDDNDPDVIITGRNNSGIRLVKLYINDGAGTYADPPGTPFVGVRQGSIAFADVDGDTDQDVLITGLQGDHVAKLYTNNGAGNFSEVLGTPFAGVINSSIAFADVDGDNDQDVLITGQYNYYTPIAKLYINDGTGNFTEAPDTPFEGVEASSTAFADVDGDNDLDVLITGQNNSSIRISKLYKNDGMGHFSEVAGTPFIAVKAASVTFSDVDGDNDLDVLITGYAAFSVYVARLYKNNGLGQYVLAPNLPLVGLVGVGGGSAAFSDVDGDNDPDVLITGLTSSGARIAKLYLNGGTGNYTVVTGTPFEGVEGSDSVAFADVDGDNDPDVLIAGRNNMDDPTAKLYINDGMGNFSFSSTTLIEPVEAGSVAFADVDGDNDPDFLITGENYLSIYSARLYINTTEITSVEEPLSASNIEFELYPNPTGAQWINLTIASAEHGAMRINIFDVTGQLVSQQQTSFGEQHFLLNISNLAKGVYFLQLNDGIRQGVQKFFVH